MSLAEIRRRFYGAGDAHAYVRSDDATYRMAYGRPMPAAGVRRQPEPEPDPMESYSAAERALLERMTVIQRDMYLEIREAAEVGDWSPSYRDLGETINGSDWRVGKMLAELQELGAIERVHVPNRLAWKLPAAGLETYAGNPMSKERR